MFIFVSITLMLGCTTGKKPYEAPKLSITIGDKKLDYITAKNKWAGAIYDREDTFKTIMKAGSGFEVPYIAIGKTVVISFMNNPPDNFTVADILIDKTGRQTYADKLITNIPVKLKAGKYSFEIKKNMASALSSYWVEGKTDFRGFRMIATWGKNECEYAFIIRTDAF